MLSFYYELLFWNSQVFLLRIKRGEIIALAFSVLKTSPLPSPRRRGVSTGCFCKKKRKSQNKNDEGFAELYEALKNYSESTS